MLISTEYPTWTHWMEMCLEPEKKKSMTYFHPTLTIGANAWWTRARPIPSTALGGGGGDVPPFAYIPSLTRVTTAGLWANIAHAANRQPCCRGGGGGGKGTFTAVDS